MEDAEQLMRTVRGRYDHLVATGKIERDPAQSLLADRLDDLSKALGQSTLAVKNSSLGWLFGKARQKPVPISGLYVWGSVGRGKTMLMDLFFERAPTKRKRRAHFHAFMSDAQDRIHRARQAILAGTLPGDDPILPVATELAAEARLLCFDEFAVSDIADAMILGRLFAKMFELGTVVVATSNVEPSRLYSGGLNRALFLPFIDLLKANVDVIQLDARTDYRSEREDFGDVFFSPLGDHATRSIETLWHRLAGDGAKPAAISFRGRQIRIPSASGDVARFQFGDLCSEALGAADYLQIAEAYHTVVLENIPVLDQARRNECKRFINLVDTFYDRHVRLIASAAAEPDALYVADDGTEKFEFQRTASRLREMRSREYFAAEHDIAHSAGITPDA